MRFKYITLANEIESICKRSTVETFTASSMRGKLSVIASQPPIHSTTFNMALRFLEDTHKVARHFSPMYRVVIYEFLPVTMTHDYHSRLIIHKHDYEELSQLRLDRINQLLKQLERMETLYNATDDRT